MTDTGLPEEEPAGFTISLRTRGLVPEVLLRGELDLRAAAELRETLLEVLSQPGGSVLLDMTELVFLDSTIISVLIMAKKRAETAGGLIRLRNVPARVQRIFAITGIEELFSVEEG